MGGEESGEKFFFPCTTNYVKYLPCVRLASAQTNFTINFYFSFSIFTGAAKKGHKTKMLAAIKTRWWRCLIWFVFMDFRSVCELIYRRVVVGGMFCGHDMSCRYIFTHYRRNGKLCQFKYFFVILTLPTKVNKFPGLQKFIRFSFSFLLTSFSNKANGGTHTHGDLSI